MTPPMATTLAVFSTVPFEHALAYLRFRAAAESLGWNIIFGKEDENTIYPERVGGADFVLIQRDFPRFWEGYQQVIAAARKENIPILYDLDDALIALPENHPSRLDYQECLESILLALVDADRVIVSSSLLAEIVSPFNDDVVVWDTLLPDLVWKIRPPLPPGQGLPVKIGYMGGLTHDEDLHLLTTVFSRLVEKFGANLEFVFWGTQPLGQLSAQTNTQFFPEVPAYPAFAEAFAQAQADIWVAPLQDNIFNRCKSAIKFWEYSAIGGTGVFSRIPPYQKVVHSGENGLLAGSEEEWYQAIEYLIQNPDARYRMGQQAHQDLMEHGLLSAHLWEWENIFRGARSNARKLQNRSAFQQAVVRFSVQLQQRSAEKERRLSQYIQEYLSLMQQHDILTQQVVQLEREQALLKEYIRVLEDRSSQLHAILHSRSWKLLLRFAKLRRLDFSPLHIPSPPEPPEGLHQGS
ncbi:MAG: glycosyltransferase [Chloroflexota bacterium]